MSSPFVFFQPAALPLPRDVSATPDMRDLWSGVAATVPPRRGVPARAAARLVAEADTCHRCGQLPGEPRHLRLLVLTVSEQDRPRLVRHREETLVPMPSQST